MAGISTERFWRLTPAELFIEIEGWNKRQDITDYRLGLLCAVIAEPYRDKEKHPDPFKPQDFMPKRGKVQPEVQTPEQQLAIVKILNAALGGDFVIS